MRLTSTTADESRRRAWRINRRRFIALALREFSRGIPVARGREKLRKVRALRQWFTQVRETWLAPIAGGEISKIISGAWHDHDETIHGVTRFIVYVTRRINIQRVRSRIPRGNLCGTLMYTLSSALEFYLGRWYFARRCRTRKRKCHDLSSIEPIAP